MKYTLSTIPETSTKEPNPETSSKDEPPKKKMKYDSQDDGTSISNEKLSDLHINLAQQLLKQQFPQLNGLQCTLFQSKKHVGKPLKDQLQVIHCRSRDHWIVTSTIRCKDGVVNIYNSVYSTLDEETKEVIANLFHSATVKMMKTQKQEGSKDCGLTDLRQRIPLVGKASPSFDDPGALVEHSLLHSSHD